VVEDAAALRVEFADTLRIQDFCWRQHVAAGASRSRLLVFDPLERRKSREWLKARRHYARAAGSRSSKQKHCRLAARC